MPSLAARVATLEARNAALTARVKALEDFQKLAIKWMKKEAKWSEEVTDMMRQINWALLATVFDGSGGANPPQDPPTWPPA